MTRDALLARLRLSADDLRDALRKVNLKIDDLDGDYESDTYSADFIAKVRRLSHHTDGLVDITSDL